MHARSLAVALLLARSAGAQVATPPTRPDPFATPAGGSLEPAATSLTFYVENDVLLGSRSTDRNYTGGFAFASGGRWVRESGLTGALRRVDQLVRADRVHRRGVVHRHAFTILGSAFTPQVLNEARPIRDDRPYASLFGVQVRRLSVDSAYERGEPRVSALSTDLTVAALGLNVAKSVQTNLHRTLRRNSGKETPYDPLGWHNQISNGGELTALYHVAYERFLAGDAPIAGRVKRSQLSWNAQGTVGYYDNVAAGVTGRVGHFLTDFWEFSSNPLNAVQQRGRPSDDSRPWEAYAFLALRGRAVAYNALLQGQFRRSAHTFDAGEIDRLLGEGEVGAAVALPIFGGSVGINWTAVAGRTAEFSGPKARAHAWGAVHLSYSARLPGQTR